MIGYEPEWVLMAVAIGLYLYDSALLLYANEGVITTSGGGWSVAFASTLRLARKELFLPSPVFAHRPVFRLTWGFPQVHSGVDTSWSARAELFTALAYPIWGMMLAVFALLPLGLFTRLGDRFVLAACVLLYVNIAVALGWLAHRRAAFGLTARRLAALAFEVLICPPFALNLVRKLSSQLRIEEDLVAAARRLQGPSGWRASRARLLLRLQRELRDEDEDSARGIALKRYRQVLLHEEAAEPCPRPKSS